MIGTRATSNITSMSKSSHVAKRLRVPLRIAIPARRNAIPVKMTQNLAPRWPAPQKPHTSDYEIVCLRRSGDVEEQAQGSADDRGGQAGGGRAQGRGCGSRSWGEHAHDLRLEVEVRRHGYERGAGSQAAAR